MSNIGSTALQTSKAETQRGPQARKVGPQQREFNQATRDLLDQARSVVEGATTQGQQLNPLIYQMLGLQPTMTDNTADLQAAQGELDAAQSQYDEAQQAFETLRGIPKGKRSKEQRQQFRQLKKEIPKLEHLVGQARDAHGRLASSPNAITGFERMDPSQIPADSPFSGQNALNQAQRTEAERLNQYLAGGEVDPTLKNQYDKAEAQLRATLTQRYGPDFENTTVGQMALQNFGRQKNEAFATWNQQMVEKYNNLAFQGQANLQNLLQNQIGLMREPGTYTAGMGANLANLAGSRLAQQQTELQNRAATSGLSTQVTQANPMQLAGAGLGTLAQIAQTPTGYDPNTGAPTGTVGGAAARGIGNAASGLYNWAVGPQASGVAGTSAGFTPAAGAAYEGAMTTEAGAGLSALV